MSLHQPTRILIVGGGGREHALAWKLGAEPGVNAIVVAPGSEAIAAEPRVTVVPDVDPLDPHAVAAVAAAHAVELAVIGPEAPLAAGVTDALVAAGVPVFGPTSEAARIETSKAFCREIAEAAGVAMADGSAFEDRAWALAYAEERVAASGGVVVKADGLAGGKGVTVCDDVASARAAIDALFAAGPARIVVEDRLAGAEASLIALCDGRDAVAMPFARDHKRLADADRGPNTGGMGAYSPLPDLDDRDADALVDLFHRPILAELARRGAPFRGALYAGLMLTPDGPRLLECNARFGDPETQAILPRLAVALGPLLLAAARGELRSALAAYGAPDRLPALPLAAVSIVLAAAGYPGAVRTGDAIEGLDEVDADALVFHSGTVHDRAGRVVTNGGRVLSVVGRGPDLAAAREAAERNAERIRWSGRQRRTDIGVVPAAAVAVAS